jgi:hypothetical protein
MAGVLRTPVYLIGGYRQEYGRIYRNGRIVADWACECPEFDRTLQCLHARQAAAIRALEEQVEGTGISSTTRQ